MIGSCDCPIKGVRLQPTIRLQCPIMRLTFSLKMSSKNDHSNSKNVL